MIWNSHSKDIPEGSHAFLSPSQYSWINYSDEKLKDAYISNLAKKRGTLLHEYAAMCIRIGQKLPRAHKTLNMYVNDAIGFRMKPEQPLKYSEFSFGTADAISFKKNRLMIFDLKTGTTGKPESHFHQLEVYASLFCLEYKVKPGELAGIELRVYKNDEVYVAEPDVTVIGPIMDKIVHFDSILKEMKEEYLDE